MNTPTDGFIVQGECVGRPRGWRRVIADFLCRHTGHLLWRSLHTTVPDPHDSLPFYGAHCKRCWRYGYVDGDRRFA